MKALLRVRVKLRRTDPVHYLVPVLTQAVDGLKEQLRLNRRHVNELIEVHVFSGHVRCFFWFACVTIMILVLAAIIYMA